MVKINANDFSNFNEEELDNFFEALQLLKSVEIIENGIVLGVMLSPDLYENVKEGL